jgi:hypothetical protein
MYSINHLYAKNCKNIYLYDIFIHEEEKNEQLNFFYILNLP